MTTVRDLAKLLGCEPAQVGDLVTKLVAETRGSIVAVDEPPPMTPRPHPLRWNRKSLKRDKGPSSPDAAAARQRLHERRATAWQLRGAGVPVVAIATRLGVAERTVESDLKWWFEALTPPDIEERRALQLDATERLGAKMYQRAMRGDGDLDAVTAWLRVMKRYDDLSHLTKVAPVIQIGPSADELEALIAAVVAGSPALPVASAPIDVESVEVGGESLMELVSKVAS